MFLIYSIMSANADKNLAALRREFEREGAFRGSRGEIIEAGQIPRLFSFSPSSPKERSFLPETSTALESFQTFDLASLEGELALRVSMSRYGRTPMISTLDYVATMPPAPVPIRGTNLGTGNAGFSADDPAVEGRLRASRELFNALQDSVRSYYRIGVGDIVSIAPALDLSAVEGRWRLLVRTTLVHVPWALFFCHELGVARFLRLASVLGTTLKN